MASRYDKQYACNDYRAMWDAAMRGMQNNDRCTLLHYRVTSSSLGRIGSLRTSVLVQLGRIRYMRHNWKKKQEKPVVRYLTRELTCRKRHTKGVSS